VHCIGGNKILKVLYGCQIVGPSADVARIPLMNMGVADGHEFGVGKLRFKVFDTPGMRYSNNCRFRAENLVHKPIPYNKIRIGQAGTLPDPVSSCGDIVGRIILL
jgi:hypothetical protein